MRLIDANALDETFEIGRACDRCKIGRENCERVKLAVIEICGIITEQKTVDAVEVVRCEDCVYYRKSHKGESGDCIFDNRHTFVLKDDFCSYGERREVKE